MPRAHNPRKSRFTRFINRYTKACRGVWCRGFPILLGSVATLEVNAQIYFWSQYGVSEVALGKLALHVLAPIVLVAKLLHELLPPRH